MQELKLVKMRSGPKNKTMDYTTRNKIHESPHYDVFVGRLPDDDIDQYLVVLRTTGVVEFACNMELYFLEWLDNVERKYTEIENNKEKPKLAEVVPISR